MKWNPWRLLIVLGIVVAALVAGPVIRLKTWVFECCPISGSTRARTVWFGEFFQKEVRTTSALEIWLKKREPAFEPRYEFVSEHVTYLIGKSYGCARAPATYSARSNMDLIVQTLGDEKIARLVAVLRNGSRDEQQKALYAAADEARDIEQSGPIP